MIANSSSAVFYNTKGVCGSACAGVSYKKGDEYYCDTNCAAINTFFSLSSTLYDYMPSSGTATCSETCDSTKVKYTSSQVVYCADSCKLVIAWKNTATLYALGGVCKTVD